jgi:hypothetical protein
LRQQRVAKGAFVERRFEKRCQRIALRRIVTAT